MSINNALIPSDRGPGASETNVVRVVPVNDSTVTSDAAPTVSLTAYSAGDLIGGKLTFSNVVLAVGGGGVIQSVALCDKAAQDCAIDLVIFDSDPSGTTFTDNAELDVADADLLKIIGVFPILNYTAFTDNAVGYLGNQSLPFIVAGTSLYGALVCRGTPTYSSTSDVKVRLGILRN